MNRSCTTAGQARFLPEWANKDGTIIEARLTFRPVPAYRLKEFRHTL